MISKTYFVMQDVDSKKFVVSCMVIDENRERVHHSIVKSGISEQKDAEEYRKALEENTKNSS